MGSREFCIHGHFYQPPREDPITGSIPNEPGAAPYRNWNQKINAECYQPNAELGNFEKISFNIGPTLFSWLEANDPETYMAILKQDRANHSRYGTGNAMAQSYNHTILPLSTQAEKMTEVKWGIADFKHRFGHNPEGMWLPETAVDNKTLEVLADCGITYTILAPWQAEDTQVDTSESYKVKLPGDKQIMVFFYDQDLSTRISFDPAATINADQFLVDYLFPKYKPDISGDRRAQLVLIASDGELYGHHQRFRDKFLNHLMNGALEGRSLKLTYPGLWVKEHPARKWMKIRDNTSWSCHHGVVRWMGDCDCTPGGGQWKSFLRTSLNQLAKGLDKLYYENIIKYVDNPWTLLHSYSQVILNETAVEEYIQAAIGRQLAKDELRRIALLLKSQFERHRMFTSCGWFFDDFDRIEPRNNVIHAAQAIRLCNEATGVDFSPDAMKLLRNVKSRRTGIRGDQVFYEKFFKIEEPRDPGPSHLNASNSFST